MVEREPKTAPVPNNAKLLSFCVSAIFAAVSFQQVATSIVFRGGFCLVSSNDNYVWSLKCFVFSVFTVKV